MVLASFVWSGSLVFNIATVFDTLVIAAVMPEGMAWVGVYSLAQNITSLIQAPQRGIVSAAISPLSRAWKEKDYPRIQQIYQRSAINQLIFSMAMFSLILMNFTDGIFTFSLKSTYTNALPVFIFIGAMRILDMGTGLNSQIIGTSTFWRFEFFTGIILLTLTLPLNYLLTKNMGVVGPAISNLIAFTIYNFIRCVFLYRKLKMQPFTIKSLYTILLAATGFIICYLLFNNKMGLEWIMIRSIIFIFIFGTGTYLLKLTPDLFHVIETVKSRIKK
jgi:O-antigen/teichoic acid export membrane protein